MRFGRRFMRILEKRPPSLKDGEFRVTPARPVPAHIVKPPYVLGQAPPEMSPKGPVALSAEQIPRLKAACRLAANTLQHAMSIVKPGVTTDDIDTAVHEFIIKHGGYPSPIGFHGFPKSVCTSPNEVICHGVPDLRPLKSGDIVNIDVTCFLEGHHGDCSATAMVGGPEAVLPEHKRLVEATKLCLDEAVKICGPGVPFSRVGDVCQKIAAEFGFAVVPHFSGHGIGADMHVAPYVHHTPTSTPFLMIPNHAFTIEPILSEGSTEMGLWSDGWTAVTKDNAWCAQWEHVVLITQDGHQVLTVPSNPEASAASPSSSAPTASSSPASCSSSSQ